MLNVNEVDSGKKLRIIETDDIYKVPFSGGQYIITTSGQVYYDPTFGTNLDSRVCLSPKREIDIYKRENNHSDDYYLNLHVKPINGDLVIIKDFILNKAIYTVYVYNDNDEDTNPHEWCKLTGTYSADNVYFDKDIIITEQIGDEPLQDGKLVIPTAGKSVVDAFETIFSKDKNPKIEQPSVNITFNEAGSYEIGSVVNPTYSITFNSGKYEYGPDTEVKATSIKVVSTNNEVKNTLSGSFNSIVVNENTNFSISTIITYSKGSIPLTIKENEYDFGQIKAGTINAKTAQILGYVNGLYYGCMDVDIDKSHITSEIIKTLNKSNCKYESKDFTFNVPVNSKTIMIACPVSDIGLTKVYNNSINTIMTDCFGEPIVVKVAGADNDINSIYAKDYNVWLYSPAYAYEKSVDLTISLG